MLRQIFSRCNDKVKMKRPLLSARSDTVDLDRRRTKEGLALSGHQSEVSLRLVLSASCEGGGQKRRGKGWGVVAAVVRSI